LKRSIQSFLRKRKSELHQGGELLGFFLCGGEDGRLVEVDHNLRPPGHTPTLKGCSKLMLGSSRPTARDGAAEPSRKQHDEDVAICDSSFWIDQADLNRLTAETG
jgi:hypothetical protein